MRFPEAAIVKMYTCPGYLNALSAAAFLSGIWLAKLLCIFEIPSYVRGYHAYKNWNPVIGETLGVRREPTNTIDKHAVAVVKDGVIVGHTPYNLAPCVVQFL